jgi:hypothetical protein
MAKLVVALVAIHGLGKRETPRLRLADLDLAAGRLLVRRDLGDHTVYLAEFTHTLAAAWLRERRRRWPVTGNPHLLVTQQTTAIDTYPPISSMVMTGIFQQLGLSLSQLRQDRILDEARHTADPVQLMRVFGISSTTALKYIYAAHPERRSTLPCADGVGRDGQQGRRDRPYCYLSGRAITLRGCRPLQPAGHHPVLHSLASTAPSEPRGHRRLPGPIAKLVTERRSIR